MSAGTSIRGVPLGGGRPARAGSEAGFTLVEVLVAMMVSTIVIGAMVTTFVKNADSSLAGQRQAQLYGVAQQQIEHIRNIVSHNGFSALALKALPVAATDCAPSHQCVVATLPASPTDPNDFIMNRSTSPGYLIETNYNNTSENLISNATSSGEPLEIKGYNTTSGLLDPLTALVPVGGTTPTVTATVSTYVTQAAVPCNTAILGTCAPDDARRVIVAVVLDNPSGSRSIGPNTPVYLSTVFSNPIPSNQPSSAAGLRLGLNIG